MWGGDLPYLTPIDFRRSICQLKSQYNGSDQHDSQEFLSFLIDGIHEDLNRLIAKPTYARTPEEEAELERLPPQIASDREWRAWKARNDSLIVDFFQGQFRSRLQCQTCEKTSTTYNVFSILQLPIPHSRSGKVPVQRCLDAFFNEEILDRDDAWDCPQCKVKRRATKKLSLARLPPVLMIHLKRFEANGRFSDKVDTFVDFPMKSLDLTNYMPPPLPPGVDKSQLNGGLPMSLEDPRTQLPPYRYDLYGVTNHYGNLSSGHYTAFVASRGGWMYCDDSSVKPVDPKQVVGQKAYVLFYKRVRL
jgi:ubiquitin carboxyl-terminal hydrolase 8